jgi:DNA polymerase I-like protein with 3'-5' exonuclease and polymerase domains
MAWTMPINFPDLSKAKAIAVDLETRDDDLTSLGPGVRRDAYIIGVAIATDDGFKGYFPVAHAQGPNLNKKAVFSWLKRELAGPQIKVGANFLYDADFLAQQDATMGGIWYDVQNAEPLIDENQGKYNLDFLGMKYLGIGKDEALLETICKLNGWKGAVQKHLWKMSAEEVGPYAIRDVENPIKIFREQRKILKSEDLWDLFLLESKLMPLLLKMRRGGVLIDTKKLDETISGTEKKLKEEKQKLRDLAGFEVEYWAAESIARAFDSMDLTYPKTAKTKKPSFTQDWLDKNPTPIAQLVLSCRKLDKFKGTFLESQINSHLVNGRLHCQFNQLRSDDSGTVSGRFSSSDPNLQFIPARDPVLGPLCRSMFIPEPECLWGKVDMSQVEFRIFAHFAQGDGAEEFRAHYNQDPNTDYHQWCADEAGIERRDAKNLNFGMIYGMGVNKLALQLNRPYGEAKEFSERYNAKLPFMRATLQLASERAQQRGYVFTILKRRRRFDMWEPSDWDLSKMVPASRDKAEIQRIIEEKITEAEREKKRVPSPGIRRAKTHKALNAIIQGSAADQMKQSMVNCHEAGVFDILKIHLTVHDELDVSIPPTKAGREAFGEMVRLMEHSIKFDVPIVAKAETGPNWGETK